MIHKETLAVITLQHKAWMDTARCCMWIDLQLGPFYAKKRGKCVRWFGTTVAPMA